MSLSTTATAEDLARVRVSAGSADPARWSGSAVSWGAIAAGAAAAASLSLILLILGVGLGLSSVSPWANDGVSATTFGVSTILWLTFTQLMSSGVGGYLAGRLRTKWTEIHTDENYFRDTAHGFLAWALSALVTATLLTSVIGSILSGGVQAGAAMVGGVAGTATTAAGSLAASTGMARGDEGGPMAYVVDSLFRRDATGAASNGGSAVSPQANERASSQDVAEVSRILMNVTRSAPLPADDIRYIGQIVAQRTGLSQQDAEKRVADVYGKAQTRVRDAEVAARDVADKARKASAYGALWLFVSLLLGAFVSSWSATFGGRRRDA